jgi:hypothetical protein
MRLLLAIVAVGVFAAGQSAPKRLFIEYLTLNYTNAIGVTRAQRNITLETTREILKRCPDAITITDKPETAEYHLRITPGSSTLYLNGDAAATFGARFRVSNLAKGVCEWIIANASSNATGEFHLSNALPATSARSDRNTDDTVSTQKPAGGVLKSSDILELKQAGISDSLIIKKVKSSPVKFDLDTSDLVALKKAGLADAVIAAMLEASRR